MARACVKRAYRYRCYPTAEQAAELVRTFGCVRKVYNLALEARRNAWASERRKISYGETSAMLTVWKKTADLSYLAEVSSVPLQQALRHLQDAFISFWQKKSGYPRFKSKHRSRMAAEYTRSGFRWRDGRLTLAKMEEPIDVRWSRPLPQGAEPSTVTVSQDSAGRWFVSLVVEDATVQPLPRINTAVGVDMGISALVTLSTGERICGPRFAQQYRAKLAKAQRVLARKALGSANREKARLKVARVHSCIRDRRRDFLQKLSTRLVRENQTVVIEDLGVRGMMRNHRMARAISDAGWRELRSMLEVKCRWYERQLVVVDRWFPSSKTCSRCGERAKKMPLAVRDWECKTCGAIHDRDINAARNILAAGLAVTACGADVRPQRGTSSRTRQSAKNQETPRATAGTFPVRG